MTERPNLGNILVGLGRIDEDDVESALEYQREHGGYFGEALLALGMVSTDELEWGLASQFDLPYIFPDADSIDPEAAALVTPEWALAHLTMPILRTADALTVVVESPTKTEAVEELAGRTDLPIELALASRESIRELIQEVYSRRHAAREARSTPLGLEEGVGLALDADSRRFGISVRDHRAWFWYQDAGDAKRRRLEGNWEAELDRLVAPPPSARVVSAERDSYDGHVNRGGLITAVRVQYLSGSGGREYLFQPIQERNVLHDRFPLPPPGLLAEIRLLARSGAAGFALSTEPDDLADELLPHLPALLLDPGWRSAHLTSAGTAAGSAVFAVELPEGDEARAAELESLRDFGFDAVTVDPSALDGGDALLEAATDVAGVTFVRWNEGLDRGLAHDQGVRWELSVRRAEGARLEWALEPFNS